MNRIVLKTAKLFVFNIVISYTLIFIETITYKGSIRNNFFISANILWLANFFIGSLFIFLYLIKKYNLNNWLSRILKLNSYLLLPLILVSLILKIIEESNYPNYVYSTLHIIPDGLDRAIFLCLFLIFLKVLLNSDEISFSKEYFLIHFNNVKQKPGIINKIKFSSFALLLLTVFFFMLINFSNLTNLITGEIGKLIAYQKSGSDDIVNYTMNKTYEDYYEYINLIKEHTSDSDTILIPPQSLKWPYEGNNRLMTSFLYPRRIISYHDDMKKEYFNKVDYIVITPGHWSLIGSDEKGFLWPDFDIGDVDIYYFNFLKENQSVKEGVKYSSQGNTSFGLIKLNKTDDK